MNNIIYIICDNVDEYHTFITKHKEELNAWSNELICVDSLTNMRVFSDSLRGKENPSGYFIGGWKKNPNINMIVESLMVTTRDVKKLTALGRVMEMLLDITQVKRVSKQN